MSFKGSLTISLVFVLFLVGVTAGCGGVDQQNTGGNTSGGQNQQSASGGSNSESGESKDASETKIAVGKIINADSDKRRFVLKPAKGEDIVFKAVPKARIKLDGKEVQLVDMKEGQQAQVEYIVREEMGVPNRARSITLFSNGAGGGGETS